MPINWACSVMEVSCGSCIALQRSFTLAFLSSVRVIFIDTESRTKHRNVIHYEGIKDDFATLITNPKAVNKVWV